MNKNVKNLRVRKWFCPECQIEHDRYINVSKNVLKEGLRIIF